MLVCFLLSPYAGNSKQSQWYNLCPPKKKKKKEFRSPSLWLLLEQRLLDYLQIQCNSSVLMSTSTRADGKFSSIIASVSHPWIPASRGGRRGRGRRGAGADSSSLYQRQTKAPEKKKRPGGQISQWEVNCVSLTETPTWVRLRLNVYT